MRHLPNIATSKPLQRLLSVLSDCAWHTTYQLCMEAEICNPSGAISDLKANGLHIITEYQGESARGARVWRYKWQGKADGVTA